MVIPAVRSAAVDAPIPSLRWNAFPSAGAPFDANQSPHNNWEAIKVIVTIAKMIEMGLMVVTPFELSSDQLDEWLFCFLIQE